MSSDALWYYTDEDRRQCGPFTEEAILSLVEQGVLSAETPLQNEDGSVMTTPDRLKNESFSAAIGCMCLLLFLALVAVLVFGFFRPSNRGSLPSVFSPPPDVPGNVSPGTTDSPRFIDASTDLPPREAGMDPTTVRTALVENNLIEPDPERRLKQVEKNFSKEKAEEAVATCETLVHELRQFKDNAGFHTYGFSRDGPYRQWYRKLIDFMESKPRIDEVGLNISILPGLVRDLSQEYKTSQGKETEFTRKFYAEYMPAAKESLEDPAKVLMPTESE